MKFLATVLLVVLIASLPLLSQKPQAASKVNVTSSQLLTRGKYLVEQVGMCQDCHTPFNEKGELVREKWLQGATLTFRPTVPIPAWAEQSVRIAGLPGWTDEQAITFLMTGKNARGVPARPPMPGYRFNRADATAITAYLKSLGGEKGGAEAK